MNGEWLRFYEEADAMPGGQAQETATADRESEVAASTDVKPDQSETPPAAPRTPEQLQAEIEELKRDRARWQTKAQKFAEARKSEHKSAFMPPQQLPQKPSVDYDGTAESLQRMVGEELKHTLEAMEIKTSLENMGAQAAAEYYEFTSKVLGMDEDEAAEHLRNIIRLSSTPEELAAKGMLPMTTEERLDIARSIAAAKSWDKVKADFAKKEYDKGYQAAMRKIQSQLPDGKTVPPAESGSKLTGFEAEVASALNKI
jgi:hypothetical protein